MVDGLDARRADKIGQALLFADAMEQAAGHAAQQFFRDIGSGDEVRPKPAVRVGHTDDRLLADRFMSFALRQLRSMGRQALGGERHLREMPETLLHKIQGGLAVKGAADADHQVAGDDQLLVEARQVCRRDGHQGLRRAGSIHAQRMIAKELLQQAQAGLFDDVIRSLAASGDRRRPLGLERLRQKLRIQNTVRHELGDLREVGTQGLPPHSAGDLRAVIGESGPHGVDEAGDFFLGALGGIARQQGREQARGSALRGFFISGACGDEHAETGLGDRVIRLEQHTDAIRQGDQFKGLRRRGGATGKRDFRGLLATHGRLGDGLGLQPLTGGLRQLFRRDLRQLRDAAAWPGDIMSDASGITIARHGGVDVLQAVDHPHDGLTTHFVQLSLRDALLQQTVDDLEVGLLDGSGLGAGIADPTQPSQADVADAHGMGVDGMDELALLAQFIPEQRTIAGAQHTEAEVQRRTAFGEEARHAPRGDALGRRDVAHEVATAWTRLRRLKGRDHL